MSLRFQAGMMIVLIPALYAASTFSLIPPTGRTAPRKVISPVMARSFLILRLVRKEVMAVRIVTPADGPSLGIPPAGTWMCRSTSSKTVSYTHLRAHETRHDLVCRLLLEKKKNI